MRLWGRGQRDAELRLNNITREALLELELTPEKCAAIRNLCNAGVAR